MRDPGVTFFLSRRTGAFLEAVNRAWGQGWFRELAGQITNGTFVELDGSPCHVEGPEETKPTDTLDLARQIKNTQQGRML